MTEASRYLSEYGDLSRHADDVGELWLVDPETGRRELVDAGSALVRPSSRRDAWKRSFAAGRSLTTITSGTTRCAAAGHAKRASSARGARRRRTAGVAPGPCHGRAGHHRPRQHVLRLVRQMLLHRLLVLPLK